VRALAVDFGEKRIGLAVSDESGSLVVPVGTVDRRSDAQAAAAVSAAAREREVERIVVGDPRNLDGTVGPRSRRARNFAARLAEASGLPVDLHGEGLTTVEAEATLREAGIPADRRARGRDAEAAAILLRDYLDARGPATTP
jgi:putative Holliday junction resolvase